MEEINNNNNMKKTGTNKDKVDEEKQEGTTGKNINGLNNELKNKAGEENDITTEINNAGDVGDDIRKKQIQEPYVSEKTPTIIYNIMLLIVSFIASRLMPLLNGLLSSISGNLNSLTSKTTTKKQGSSTNINEEYESNELIIEAINLTLSDPEVMKKWDKTAMIIASYIRTLMEQINDEVLTEVEDTLNRLISILERNTQNAVLNIATSIVTAICAIPIISPFCEALDLASLIISTSATSVNSLLSILSASSKITGVFANVIGDKISGLEEIVGLLNNMIETISIATNVVNSGTNKLNNFNQELENKIQEYNK